MMCDRNGGESEVRILLVGKTGAGKSATGNTILGQNTFEASVFSSSAGKVSTEGSVRWEGRNVVVTDTPGFFHTELTWEQTVHEIRKSALTAPGYHAILLVIAIGPYTKEEKETIEKIVDTFGPHAMRYMIVVLTRKDDLEAVSIHDCLNKPCKRSLRELTEKCGNRCFAINNKAPPEIQKQQAKELLTMIDRMVEQNNRSCYSGQMFPGIMTQCSQSERGTAEKCKPEIKEKTKIEEAKKCEMKERTKEKKYGYQSNMRGDQSNEESYEKIQIHSEERYAKNTNDEKNKPKTPNNLKESETVSSTAVNKNIQVNETVKSITLKTNMKNVNENKGKGNEKLGNSATWKEERKTNNAVPMPCDTGETELRLILVGKTGVGKSATGNTLLGENKFKTRTFSSSVDKLCKKETVTWKEKNIVVIDTPGCVYTELTHEQAVKDIGTCITLSLPGPHAIVLVVSIRCYTENDKKIIERIRDTFGDHALRYMMVLLTHEDYLEDVSLQDYLCKPGSKDLQDLIQMCGNRFCAFNNQAPTEEKEKRVHELLTMIGLMMEQNNGACYTMESYRIAQKVRSEETKQFQGQIRGKPELMEEIVDRSLKNEANNMRKQAKIYEKEQRNASRRPNNLASDSTDNCNQVNFNNYEQQDLQKNPLKMNFKDSEIIQLNSPCPWKKDVTNLNNDLKEKDMHGKKHPRCGKETCSKRQYSNCITLSIQGEIEKTISSDQQHNTPVHNQTEKEFPVKGRVMATVKMFSNLEKGKKQNDLSHCKSNCRLSRSTESSGTQFVRKSDLNRHERLKDDLFTKRVHDEFGMNQSEKNKMKDKGHNTKATFWTYDEKEAPVHSKKIEKVVQTKDNMAPSQDIQRQQNSGILTDTDRPLGKTACSYEQKKITVSNSSEQQNQINLLFDKPGEPYDKTREAKKQEVKMEQHQQPNNYSENDRNINISDQTVIHLNGVESEVRLVLVGISGAGKSTSANTIIGQNKFNSRVFSGTEKTYKKEIINWRGTNVVVIDTPGIFDMECSPEQVIQEVRTCFIFSPPGPHAIVLVVRIGRYTEEEKKTIQRIQDTFGDQAARYMVVLFTRKDDLEDVPIQEYVRTSGSAELKGLIQKCGNRYCAFNNRASPEERKAQATELLTIIERMVEQNNWTCYISEMYDQAEKIHLEKLEERRRQNRNPLEIEQEKLMQQFEEEIKKMQELANIREEELMKGYSKKNNSNQFNHCDRAEPRKGGCVNTGGETEEGARVASVAEGSGVRGIGDKEWRRDVDSRLSVAQAEPGGHRHHVSLSHAPGKGWLQQARSRVAGWVGRQGGPAE